MNSWNEKRAENSAPLTIPVGQVIPGRLLSSRARFRFACLLNIERTTESKNEIVLLFCFDFNIEGEAFSALSYSGDIQQYA
jgi:hypothetical protein